MNITILGAGNMGGAIALGLVKSKAVKASDITVTAAHAETLRKFEEQGFRTSTDNSAAIKDAGIIFIAVKPWIVPTVAAQVSESLASGASPLIVSVAPGVKPADLLEMLGQSSARVAYLIPNTAIEVLQSMTFICNVSAAKEDITLLEGLFSRCGRTMVVGEDKLGAGTALASCGIAYALRYVRAAVEGGVELGFYAGDATQIVAQTIQGAASLLLESGSHPEEEIDKVTTPGGLTIKGLNAMEDAGFTNAVIKGLKAGR